MVCTLFLCVKSSDLTYDSVYITEILYNLNRWRGIFQVVELYKPYQSSHWRETIQVKTVLQSILQLVRLGGIRMDQPGDIQLSWPVCDNMFPSLSKSKLDMVIHSNEKPFK